jgi:hypothetical protein
MEFDAGVTVTPPAYGQTMRSWEPTPGEPELFDWWRPLLEASKRARWEEVPWPIHVDQFTLGGHVERGKKQAVIWVYVHRANQGEILADWGGQTYEFIRYRSGPQLGRFKRIDVRSAIWRARLPEVVKPIWYDEPSPRLVQGAAGNWSSADQPHPPTADEVREGRHLRLVAPPA